MSKKLRDAILSQPHLIWRMIAGWQCKYCNRFGDFTTIQHEKWCLYMMALDERTKKGKVG